MESFLDWQDPILVQWPTIEFDSITELIYDSRFFFWTNSFSILIFHCIKTGKPALHTITITPKEIEQICILNQDNIKFTTAQQHHSRLKIANFNNLNIVLNLA